MRQLIAIGIAIVVSLAAVLEAQTKRPPARRGTPPPTVEPKKVAPEMTCPSPLGIGVDSKLKYCDVMTERDPSAGILIELPPHKGPVTLTFDLHNRHTYSDEQAKTNRGYARYTATIGVLTMDNTLISRATVQNEFRNASDLVERIGGGAGPGGVKAVAPTGSETITITIPEAEQKVSILGEKLTQDRLDGSATYVSPGRPIAVVSNVMIAYQPGPPARGRASAKPAR